MNINKKVILGLIIIIVILIASLIFTIIFSKRADTTINNVSVTNNDDKDQDKNNVDIYQSNKEYIYRKYKYKQYQDDGNNSNKKLRFENFHKNSYLLDAIKILNINDIDIKIENNKIKLKEKEYLNNVNFAVSGIKNNKLMIYAALFDGTISQITCDFENINNNDNEYFEDNYILQNLNIDSLKINNNYNDLKYIIDISKTNIEDPFGNNLLFFEFRDIDGYTYIDYLSN